MSDITISVPDEWADVVSAGSLEWAKLDILRGAVSESAGKVRELTDCDWTDAVGEPLPRLVREIERLQSLTAAAREIAKNDEAKQVVRLAAIEGGK